MTRIAELAANHATTLTEAVPHGVDVHLSWVATKKVVAITWSRSPFRRYVATVKYGGMDMERRPLFLGVGRYDVLAKEFVDNANLIKSSLLVGARFEGMSVRLLSRGTQILARRRVVRTSAVHRLR